MDHYSTTEQYPTTVRYFIAGTHSPFHEETYSTVEDINYNNIAKTWLDKGYEIVKSDLPMDKDSPLAKSLYTIYLREKITMIVASHPQKEGELVDFSQVLTWPAGVDQDALNKIYTREILYLYENGSEAFPPLLETITFERDVAVNHSSNEITYMAWQPIRGTHFLEITSPELAGYYPSQLSIPERQVSEEDIETYEQVVVIYHQADLNVRIDAVDIDTDTILESHQVTGKAGEEIDYPISSLIDAYLIQGYELVDNDLEQSTYFLADFNQEQEKVYQIRLKQKVVTVDFEEMTTIPTDGSIYPELDGSPIWPRELSESYLKKEVHRKIEVYLEDEASPIDTIVQTISFKRNGTYNFVTKEVTYTSWVSEKNHFPAYHPEERKGYRVKPRSIPEVLEVSAKDSDVLETIVYRKKIQEVRVQFVDITTSEVVLFTQSLIGKTGDPLIYDWHQKLQEFYRRGYQLVDSNFPESGQFSGDSDQIDYYKIQLSERIIEVCSEQPHLSGTPVDEEENSPMWPSGVDSQNLRRSIRRTINYLYENGQTAHVADVDVVSFERDAQVNLVSGEVTYGNWKNDSLSFDERMVPVIKGYYPHKQIVDVIEDVHVDSTDFQVDIYYIPVSDSMLFKFIYKPSGQVLKEEQVCKNSYTNLKKEIDKRLVPFLEKGYRFLSANIVTEREVILELDEVVLDVTADLPHPAYTPIEQYPLLMWPSGLSQEDLQKVHVRRIDYIYIDGSEARPSDYQSVSLTRTATVSLISGTVHYSEWIANADHFEAHSIEPIEGYESSVVSVPREAINIAQPERQLHVIYYPTPSVVEISYVDVDSKEELLLDQLNGYLEDSVSYNVYEKLLEKGLKGYEVVSTTCPENLVMNETTQHYTVEVRPCYVTVPSHTQYLPHTSSYIENYGMFCWPLGLDIHSLERHVCRTIQYVSQDGVTLFEPVVQKATLRREAKVNLVTKEVLYSEWQSDIDIFEAIESPWKEGLNPDKQTVEAVDVYIFKDFYDLDVKIIYSPVPYSVHVTIEDLSNQEILEQLVLRGRDTSLLEKQSQALANQYVSSGYQIEELPQQLSPELSDQELVIKVRPSVFTVTIEHVESSFQNLQDSMAAYLTSLSGLSKFELSRHVKRQIRYLYSNGKTAAPAYLEEVSFTRTAEVNLVTGQITYGTWNSFYNIFDEVLSPFIEGYSPSKEICEAIEDVQAEDAHRYETVIYHRANQEVLVNYIDRATGEVLKTESLRDISKTYLYKSGRKLDENIFDVPELVDIQDEEDSSTSLNEADEEDSKASLVSKEIKIFKQDTDLQKVYDIDPSHLQQICKRIISYRFVDGREAAPTVEQLVEFTRYAIYSKPAQTYTYSDWKAEGLLAFEEIVSPAVTGYQPERDSLPTIIPDPESDQEVIEEIVYHEEFHSVELEFVDEIEDTNLLAFKFQMKSQVFIEKQVNKGLSFMKERNYQLVDSNYPNNGTLLQGNTTKFTFVMRKVSVDDEQTSIPTTDASDNRQVFEEASVEDGVTHESSTLSLNESKVDSELVEEKSERKNRFFDFLFVKEDDKES